MSYEVESRGKKMHMNKNIARLAVTAGLTAALSFGGVMAPVTMAFAEGTPVATTSGNVTINEETYKDTTFKGIQIFKAKVTQDQWSEGVWDSTGDKTLSDIDWASPKVKKAVTDKFSGVAGAPTGNASVQEWIAFINNNAGNNTNVDTGSTLDKIAEALEDAGATDSTLGWQSSTTGNFTGLESGYWLFVTAGVGSTKDTDTTNGNIDAYTSPIFTIVGGESVNVTPKKDVPNVTKAVKDDNNGSFVDSTKPVPAGSSRDVFTTPNRVADSASDQLVEYQLAGTVASNINTYNEYSYAFTDVLPSTMTPELDDNGRPVVEVKIDNQVVHSGSYSKEYKNGQLVVSFSDLKKAHLEKEDGTEGAVINVDGKSKVYVNYKARLEPTKVNANMLGKGQKNTVTLTYSNNPHSNGTGTTVEHPAYDYTYGIDVTKVGNEETPKKLSGVVFKLQEKNGDTVEDKYIDANGVKQASAEDAKLTTTEDGKISVIGLDEGTYVLTEVTPAPGYDNSHGNKGITFTITRGTLSESDATVVNPAVVVTDGDNTGLVRADNSTGGMVHLTVTDKKGSNLPLTGLNGVTFTWIAGGAVLCIGVAHLIRSRKQAEESEQE